jgi:hypothetical protein
MIQLSPVDISSAIGESAEAESHPIISFAKDEETEAALIDAAQGGFEGTKKLLKNKKAKPVSRSDLHEVKLKAEAIGHGGEGLVNGYLSSEKISGHISDYDWASNENAILPFDFKITMPDGTQILIDVKTTSGDFSAPFHISMAEIIEAAESDNYKIYRVSGINDDGGHLRVSENIKQLCVSIKTAHEESFSGGIRADSFSISTSELKWGDSLYFAFPDEEQSDKN